MPTKRVSLASFLLCLLLPFPVFVFFLLSLFSLFKTSVTENTVLPSSPLTQSGPPPGLCQSVRYGLCMFCSFSFSFSFYFSVRLEILQLPFTFSESFYSAFQVYSLEILADTPYVLSTVFDLSFSDLVGLQILKKGICKSVVIGCSTMYSAHVQERQLPNNLVYSRAKSRVVMNQQ